MNGVKIFFSLFFVSLFLGCKLDSTQILTGAGEQYLKNKQLENADRVVRCREYSNGDVVCTETYLK